MNSKTRWEKTEMNWIALRRKCLGSYKGTKNQPPKSNKHKTQRKSPGVYLEGKR